ncbi:MAG: GspE/PulE family protein [Thermodesulfobacteriota bacterium]
MLDANPAFPRPPKIENPKFFQLLEAKNIIDSAFIEDLLEEFDGNALDVLATLIQSGVGTKRQLCQLWCDSIGIAHVDLEKTLFQPHIVRKMPERIARYYYAIPVYQMGDTVTVATATPESPEIAAAIEQAIGGPVSLVFALPQDIEAVIESQYQTNSALYDFFNKIAAGHLLKTGQPITEKRLADAAGKEAINQLHVALALFGITQGASEIHVRPQNDAAVIEFLVNQKPLHPIALDQTLFEQLTGRLKTLAKLDLTNVYRPQYGRILMPTPGKKIDIKVETHPAGDKGEHLALKLTDRKPYKKIAGLKQLHLARRVQDELDRRQALLKGHLVLAGPARRAGKTALAYAIADSLKKAGKQIKTVETHLKFLLPGIDQNQVNTGARISAADLLDFCLKQQPDAVYIQHLEEAEITKMASQAALSGRFVLSGIAADTAADALEKLMASGGGTAISAILTQHLVARLCDHCKQQYKLPDSQVDMLFIRHDDSEVFAWRENGCAYCNYTGFSGQLGVHELMVIDNAMRKLIIDQAPIDQVRSHIPAQAHYGLRYDGMKKVLRGLTTLDEIHRLPEA